MSRSYWGFIFALGLTLAASSGQAQQEASGGQGGAYSQEQPPETLLIPFPAYTVGNEPTAETRQRREEEARQREIADLVAQQGMNAATQSMNVATQRMAQYAFWSTVFVAVGTGLLFWTLHLTRQANEAARAAVDVTREIGQDQVRAHLAIHEILMAKVQERGDFEIMISLSNTGQTQARNLGVAAEIAVGKDLGLNFDVIETPKRRNYGLFDLAPGEKNDIGPISRMAKCIGQPPDKDGAYTEVIARIAIDYADIFGCKVTESIDCAGVGNWPVPDGVRLSLVKRDIRVQCQDSNER